MNASAETAARKLAQGLLDVIADAPDGPAAMSSGLGQVGALLRQLPEARAYLEHPRLPDEAKETVIAALAQSGDGARDLLGRLLRVLAERRALQLLPSIERHFVDAWNARRRVVVAEAVSAVPLAKAATEALRCALERASQKSVELTTAVDPALLGGVVVRFSGRTLDGSVRGRLKALRERLRQTAAR